MPSLVRSDVVRGPAVVLVHGVGVGPRSFEPVAAELARHHRVLVVERPTGEGGSALPLDRQAELLVAALDDAGIDDVVWAGTSGGATLGLVAAIAHPGRFTALVLHEPLVGRHVPELHDRFQAAAARAALGDAETMDVVRSVMGEATWDRLGPVGRTASRDQAGRWRSEIAAFARFCPAAADLAGLEAVPTLVTVGADSDPVRADAARILAELAGATVATIVGAGNVAQVDAPIEFARTIAAWRPAPSGARP